MNKLYSTLSSRLIHQLEDNKNIQASDIPAVRYTLDYLYHSVLYHTIILLIGIVTDHVLFTVIYIFTLGLLKHFTGGAHAPNEAPNEVLCSLLSYGIFLATLIMKDYVNITSIAVNYSLLGLNTLIVLLLSPVECKNKQFSNEQRIRLKHKSCLTLLVLLFLISYSLIHSNYYVATVIMSCLTINSTNLIIGYFINIKGHIHVS